jgi:hypothetical protein
MPQHCVTDSRSKGAEMILAVKGSQLDHSMSPAIAQEFVALQEKSVPHTGNRTIANHLINKEEISSRSFVFGLNRAEGTAPCSIARWIHCKAGRQTYSRTFTGILVFVKMLRREFNRIGVSKLESEQQENSHLSRRLTSRNRRTFGGFRQKQNHTSNSHKQYCNIAIKFIW